ncbi:vesicle transport through interaction with t-SNAREs homolog 1A [Rhagoletis pomonella]|uniref:vesicle transport through interaction with t-SNAREs homolog 1A n=1 Tax=Rhagoletis pomonella TaxID=28610 RepID=UPI001780F027|nr:vesicle transport through interaction with t-SNAREs homolog 1A [Rhagoletis pomonella]
MSRGYNWQNSAERENAAQSQLVANTHDILERSSASIQRSNQVAIETEQIGTEVLTELNEQRESLLRSSRRLQDADADIVQSRNIIRKLRRELLYNKLVLVLIIILEICVLAGLIVIKFVRF